MVSVPRDWRPSRPPTLAMLTWFTPPSRKMTTNFLVHEKIWFDKFKYDEAERSFYERMNGPADGAPRQVRPCCPWVSELGEPAAGSGKLPRPASGVLGLPRQGHLPLAAMLRCPLLWPLVL